MDLKYFAYQTLNIFLDLMMVLILIRVVTSWFQMDRNPITNFIFDASEFFLKPLRNILPRMGMLDLSPMIAFFCLEILRRILHEVFF